MDPWGEERADLRSAIVASVVANANRGKRGKTFKPADFMPQFGVKEKKTAKELKAKFGMFTKMHNATIKRKKKT